MQALNMSFKDVHCYDAETKEYLYSEEPQKGVKGEALLPADSTQVAPNFKSSHMKEGHVFIFDVNNQTWSITFDFRGICYNKITLEEEHNTSLRTLQSHLTKSVPDMECPVFNEETNVFEVDLVKKKLFEAEDKKEITRRNYREESALGYLLDSERDNLPLSLDGITMDCKFEDIERLHSGYTLAVITNDLDMTIRTYDNVSITIATSDCLALIKKLGKVAQVRLEGLWAEQDKLG